jgi:hypothetical protein
MSEAATNLEALLREALAPVEPPADLVTRLEDTLTSITELAADELADWELSAMRDPRNWLRPAVALLAGGTAGGALLVLRARRRAQEQRRRARAVRAMQRAGLERARAERARAERAMRAMSDQARRRLGER